MAGGEPKGDRERGAGPTTPARGAGTPGAPSPGAPAADTPGPLSRLLEELAASPGEALLAAWGEELRPGDRLDRFEIVAVLGRGGFGTVYEAQDGELGRRVAIKTLRPGRAGKEFSAGWIRKEAEAVARLGHPGIVTVHDVCNCASGPYMVMELLRGQTLQERQATDPLPPAEAQRIAEEMAKALAHAHGRGVLHRDLKPANVFLCEDGGVKLLDFGLAHLLGQPNEGSGGTPAYMAPEQARGERVDERADVFAAGKVLGETLGERAPRRLAEAVRAATDPDPAARPRDGTAWLEVLERTRRAGERTHRLRIGVAVAAGLLAVLAAVAGVATWRERRSQVVPDADGRVTVAVADFVNDTRDAELDGLSTQLITSLEQSQRLRVLTRSRMVDVLRQLGKPAPPVVDEVLGRELARAAGVRALVVASIRRFDDLYAIDLKALDPSTSEYLFTLKEERAGKASIPGMIDRLSDRVRERLRESPAEVSRDRIAVGDSITRNYEALAHYFAGLKLEDAQRYRSAIAEYRKAVAADPRFALANYRLAYVGGLVQLDVSERKSAMQAALREIDRVPAKERLLFQAWKAHLDERNDEAHAIYARAADAYPQDKEVQYLAGQMYGHEGRYAEALPWLERALALDPAWPDPLDAIISHVLPPLGRGDEALVRARRWVERTPGSRSGTALTLALIVTGRKDEAVEVARRHAAEYPDPATRDALAFALMMADRFAEAEELLRPFVAEGAGERWGVLPWLVSSLSHQGRVREAAHLVDVHSGKPDTPFWWGPGLRWNVLSQSRDLGPARRAAREFEDEAVRQGQPGTDFIHWNVWTGDEPASERMLARERDPARRRLQGALVALRRGDSGLALREARAVRAENPGKVEFVWVHAFLASEAGQDAEAIAATDDFERIIHLNPWRAWGVAMLLFRKAEAQERLGDGAGARDTAERLLARWRRADPDLPLLSETRALCRRLGCGAPATPSRR